MKKKITFIAVFCFIFYLFLGYIFPIMLVGKPLPLFEVCNRDSKVHKVRVVILSGGKEVFNETYILKPQSCISHARGFGWYPKPTFTLITWAGGRYTFEVSTENGKISKNLEVHPWMTIRFIIKSGEVHHRVIMV